MDKKQNNPDYEFTILLLGGNPSGKTSLLNRYVENAFNPGGLSTIGIDSKIKLIKIDNYEIKIKILDTAGAERFKSLLNIIMERQMDLFLILILLINLHLK